MSQNWTRGIFSTATIGLVLWTGCSKPPMPPTPAAPPATPTPAATTPTAPVAAPAAPVPQATAKAEDVQAARARLDAVAKATYAPKTGDLLTEIVIPDCSPLTAEDVMSRCSAS